MTSEQQLGDIMRGILGRCPSTAAEYGSPGDHVAEADIAGFVQVADAMPAQGHPGVTRPG